MSTAAEHQRREQMRKWRRVRRGRDWLRELRIILRPFYLPFIAAAGLYLALQELQRSPLHHNTIIWVLGFGLAGVAIFGGYKEIRIRLVLRRWLDLDDLRELRSRLPEVRKAAAQLPVWHRARLQAKQALIEDAASFRARPSHASASAPRKRPRGLGVRLRGSAAFVLSVLVLGVVGAYAFVQWLQIILTNFGNPVLWLMVWVSVVLYFSGVGAAVVLDSWRRQRGQGLTQSH